MAKKPNPALEQARKMDPGARQLWDVQGPRDNASRIIGVLARSKGELLEIVAHVFGDDSVQWYTPWTGPVASAVSDAEMAGAHDRAES